MILSIPAPMIDEVKSWAATCRITIAWERLHDGRVAIKVGNVSDFIMLKTAFGGN